VGDARPEVVRLLKTYESATQDVDTNVREFAARFFLTTGELKRGEGVLRPHGDTSLNSILVELARGDMKVANSNARDFLKKNPRFTSGIATLILVKSGCSAEADQMLRETPRVLKSDSAAIRAEIALQKRRYPLAVGLFRKAISARAFHCYDSYYLAAESLASALQHQGRLAEAIQVLEDAAVQKAATYSSELVLWGRSWILVRAKQAELYRKAGRVAEARLVELDLGKHLAFADPDDVIAARIRR
jgi:tetratricopeptide (TPR) repeat protein